MCSFISRTYYQRSLKKYIIDCFIRPQYLAIYKVPYLTFKLGSLWLWIWLYRVSHGKLGFLNQFWQIYASQILFEGGFEILRPEKFCHHNQFSWNAYISPSKYNPNLQTSPVTYLGNFKLLCILVVIFKQ